MDEKTKKEIIQVFQEELIGTKWMERGERFALVNDKPKYKGEKKSRLFAFERGWLFPQSIEEIYSNENMNVVIRENKEHKDDNFLWAQDKSTGMASRWITVKSYDTRPEDEIIKDISSSIEFYIKYGKSEGEKYYASLTDNAEALHNLLKPLDWGYYSMSNYNGLYTKSPDEKFYTTIKLGPSKGMYLVKDLNEELKRIKDHIKGETGLEPSSKKEFKIEKNDYRAFKFGELVYEENIGQLTRLSFLKLTDERLKKEAQYIDGIVENFNWDGKRLMGHTEEDFMHKTTVILYPDQFIASDSGGGGRALYSCTLEDLKMYKKEQKCHNWWIER